MKTVLMIGVVSLATAFSSLAAVGIWESYVVLNVNNSGNVYYDANANTAHPDFLGATLGIFNPTVNSLVLKGGEVKTYKSDNDDVLAGYLHYRVWASTPSGSFTAIHLPWVENLSKPGDQKWQTTSANVNLLSGLPNGTYTVDIYFTARGKAPGGSEFDVYDNRNGLNYTATFSVVPEPATWGLIAATGLLGVAGVREWRRRREEVGRF
jgi:hypothetical protein